MDSIQFCPVCRQEIVKEFVKDHVEACMEKFNFAEKKRSNYRCAICNKDLTHLSVMRRNHHANSCIDSQELDRKAKEEASSKNTQPAQGEINTSPALFSCPVCFLSFNDSKLSMNHIKSCFAKSNYSVDQVMAGIELEKQYTEQRRNLGLPVMIPRNKVIIHRKKGTSKKHPVAKVPKNANEEELHIAVALSLSSKEEEDRKREGEDPFWSSWDDTFEPSVEARKKCRKKINKEPIIPPLLVLRTDEQRQKIIQMNVERLMHDVVSPETSRPERSICQILQSVPKPSRFRNRPASDKEATFWNRSKQLNRRQDDFYVTKLRDYISPSKITCGSKLKHLSQIPGHQISHTFLSTERDSMTKSKNELLKESIPRTQVLAKLLESNIESENVTHNESFLPHASPTCSYKGCGFLTNQEQRGIAQSSEVQFLKKFSSDFKKLVDNDDFHDLIIKVKDSKTIKAHTVIIASRCSSILKDISNTNPPFVLDWSHVSYKGAYLFLEFLYTAMCTCTPEENEEVVFLATRYTCRDIIEYLRCSSKEEEGPQNDFLGDLLKSMWQEDAHNDDNVKEAADLQEMEEKEMEKAYIFLSTQKRPKQGITSTEEDLTEGSSSSSLSSRDENTAVDAALKKPGLKQSVSLPTTKHDSDPNLCSSSTKQKQSSCKPSQNLKGEAKHGKGRHQSSQVTEDAARAVGQSSVLKVGTSKRQSSVNVKVPDECSLFCEKGKPHYTLEDLLKDCLPSTSSTGKESSVIPTSGREISEDISSQSQTPKGKKFVESLFLELSQTPSEKGIDEVLVHDTPSPKHSPSGLPASSNEKHIMDKSNTDAGGSKLLSIKASQKECEDNSEAAIQISDGKPTSEKSSKSQMTSSRISGYGEKRKLDQYVQNLTSVKKASKRLCFEVPIIADGVAQKSTQSSSSLSEQCHEYNKSTSELGDLDDDVWAGFDFGEPDAQIWDMEQNTENKGDDEVEEIPEVQADALVKKSVENNASYGQYREELSFKSVKNSPPTPSSDVRKKHSRLHKKNCEKFQIESATIKGESVRPVRDQQASEAYLVTPEVPCKTNVCQKKKVGVTPVTPMPDYDNMKTPELSNQLKKFGIRPGLKKGPARQILKHVYEETHPFVTDSESDISFRESQAHHSIQNTRIGASSQRNTQEIGSQINPPETAQPANNNIESYPAYQAWQSCKVSQENANDDEQEGSLSPSSSSDDDLPEQGLLSCSSESSPTKWSPSKTNFSNLLEFVRTNEELYNKILCYEDSGIKASSSAVKDLMDQQGIFYQVPRPAEYREKQKRRNQRFRNRIKNAKMKAS